MSTTRPIVSVVMPVYNVERFVAEAVQSVLDQRFEDFELIIVDDGGTDRSVEICRSFTDHRIRIVSQANRGLAGARNTGIRESLGRYIALLDSDDRWHPSKLMLHVIHLENNGDVDISYSGSRMIDANGRVLRTAMRPQLSAITPQHILLRNPVGNGSSPVIRRRALDRVRFPHPDEPQRHQWFDESFRQSEDIELWLRMSAGRQCKFEGIAGLLTDYRIVGGGLSANIVRQFESWDRAITRTATYAPALIAESRNTATAYQLRYLARRAVQLGDGPFALSLVCQAMAKDPTILLAEPIKSAVTFAAATAARLLPPALFRRIAARRIGVEMSA